ncbi:MAG: NtaA/DmoA family FMN-dependent monooxygenase, partial [bacterium]
ADEYMEVMYRLWEGSWEDDAVRADKATGVFADPSKVHRVRFDGEFYNVDAIHLCEPSPQRTPVLFQAGASGRGRAFAARHAECVFINGTSKAVASSFVADLRARAVAQGRRADDVRIFSMATVVVGRDESEARAKLADYRSHVRHESALAVLSGWSGVDLAKYGLDEPLRYEKTEAIQSFMDHLNDGSAQRPITMRELAERTALGGGSPLIVGSPAQVADELEAWVDQTGIDGFNLAYVVMPETFTDFVDQVVPELQRRGRLKAAYPSGTLRQKLFGRTRVPDSHPAAALRPNAGQRRGA